MGASAAALGGRREQLDRDGLGIGVVLPDGRDQQGERPAACAKRCHDAQVVSWSAGVFVATDDRRLVPKESHLASAGHKLLMTRLGQLDVLGELGEDESYEALLADSIAVRVDAMSLRVLGLPRLIAAKERAGREKDKAVLPLLRSTLARVRKT